MKWKKEELVHYFQDMQKRLKEVRKDLYLCPTLTQWSHFFNIDGSKLSSVGFSELWDTAMRGIDLYEIAPFVDVAQFIAVPITPLGDPNPYIVSVQHSMMRCMNEGREFLGGIYQSCQDLGYEVDIIDINAVADGKLKNYAMLIIPCNQAYIKDRCINAEENLKKWVQQGGILMHGPSDDLVTSSIGLKGNVHERDEIIYHGGGIVQCDIFESFEGETILTTYEHSNKGAVVKNNLGQGKVYSFGYLYGSNYAVYLYTIID